MNFLYYQKKYLVTVCVSRNVFFNLFYKFPSKNSLTNRLQLKSKTNYSHKIVTKNDSTLFTDKINVTNNNHTLRLIHKIVTNIKLMLLKIDILK